MEINSILNHKRDAKRIEIRKQRNLFYYTENTKLFKTKRIDLLDYIYPLSNQIDILTATKNIK